MSRIKNATIKYLETHNYEDLPEDTIVGDLLADLEETKDER